MMPPPGMWHCLSSSIFLKLLLNQWDSWIVKQVIDTLDQHLVYQIRLGFLGSALHFEIA